MRTSSQQVYFTPYHLDDSFPAEKPPLPLQSTLFPSMRRWSLRKTAGKNDINGSVPIELVNVNYIVQIDYLLSCPFSATLGALEFHFGMRVSWQLKDNITHYRKEIQRSVSISRPLCFDYVGDILQLALLNMTTIPSSGRPAAPFFQPIKSFSGEYVRKLIGSKKGAAGRPDEGIV
jgi:hypothetical protein